MADVVFVEESELAGKLICSSPLGRAGGAAEERSDEAAERRGGERRGGGASTPQRGGQCPQLLVPANPVESLLCL